MREREVTGPSREKPIHVGQGIALGMRDLGIGLYKGLTGIVVCGWDEGAESEERERRNREKRKQRRTKIRVKSEGKKTTTARISSLLFCFLCCFFFLRTTH